MKASEAVVSFLNRNRSRFYCDSCLQARCALEEAAQAAKVAAALAMTPDYLRKKAQCAECASLDRMATCAA